MIETMKKHCDTGRYWEKLKQEAAPVFRCGFEHCRHGHPEHKRANMIAVEWYEDTPGGSRTHVWMDFCSWECLDDWRKTEAAL